MGTLTARQEKLLVLFKGAIEREREAQRTYAEALELNEDPGIRPIIEGFIRQEKTHEETLLRIYGELRTTGEFKDET
jgi:rubrerythrin